MPHLPGVIQDENKSKKGQNLTNRCGSKHQVTHVFWTNHHQMLLIYLLCFVFSTLIGTSDASISPNNLHRSTMYMFYQLAGDTAQTHSMKFEKPKVREKVYFGVIANMYHRVISPTVKLTSIKPPVLSHKGLYKAIRERYTFRPVVLYNKSVSFYAWLPHLPGATHISMTSNEFYMVIVIVSGNPIFNELRGTLIFDELARDERTNLVEYPKTLVPRIDGRYRSNIFIEMFSTIIMILNFMSVAWPDPKTLHANFRWYFMNSRVEFVTAPNDLELTLQPFALIPHPDTPIAFKQNEYGICDAVMMHPEAANSLHTMVISREENTVALLHLTPTSRIHPHAVKFFNGNSHKLVGEHFSMDFKLEMRLLSEFRKDSI